MNNKIKCFLCDWQGSKYELLIGMNGVKCPKCEKHIPQDAEGWISINNGLPEEGGFYSVKTTVSKMEMVAPFSFTMDGNGVWVLPDPSIITHWKLKQLNS